jgi:hypothetical protein
MMSVVTRNSLLALTAIALSANLALAQNQMSKPFAGSAVNGGTVTMTMKDGQRMLTLSSDFKVPDTPDPHWQVVDSKGRVYLLQRLGVKSLGGLVKDKVNMTITVPSYVEDVAKVQIYCAWAEAVLGETTFGPGSTNTR